MSLVKLRNADTELDLVTVGTGASDWRPVAVGSKKAQLKRQPPAGVLQYKADSCISKQAHTTATS